jgi:hypothetical protein
MDISNEEYALFVDFNIVSKRRIVELALKVMKGSKNFSTKEFAIFCERSAEINETIKLLTKK